MGYDDYMMILVWVRKGFLGFGSCITIWGWEFDMIPSLFLRSLGDCLE